MDEFTSFVKRLIVGADDVWFRDVVSASTGKEILKIEESTKLEIAKIKSQFRKNLTKLSDEVKTGYVGRANELGNFLEPIVSREINEISGLTCKRPKQMDGTKQSAGYPDFVITGKMPFYFEIKAFQEKTKDSSLRTFYYRPSDKAKITMSCPHLLIGFVAKSLGGENKSPFSIINFKIIDLYNLKVNLKPEFNASNVALYSCEEL